MVGQGKKGVAFARGEAVVASSLSDVEGGRLLLFNVYGRGGGFIRRPQ